jgi:hypothetical protein
MVRVSVNVGVWVWVGVDVCVNERGGGVQFERLRLFVFALY